MANQAGDYGTNVTVSSPAQSEQQAIIDTIMRVGQSMGAEEKVILAALEAAYVESGMRNLNYGDRDSVGVFQQRPSQGWGTVEQIMDVEYAAKQFFTRALQSKYRTTGTAGQLAQDVQRSAFPERYDQNQERALATLRGMATPGSPHYIQQRGGEQTGGAAPAQQQLPDYLGGAGAPGAGQNYMPKLTPKFIPRTDEEINKFIQANFGADVWWLDVPEVHDILWSMAKDGNTDGAEASRRVKATKWYQNTAAVTRNFDGRKKVEHESVASDIREQVAFLQQQVTAMGFSINPARLSSIAESSLRFGWSPAQIKAALGAEYQYDPSSKNQAASIGIMKQVAAKYMIPLSDEALGTWAEGMMRGDFTEEQFLDYAKGTAKSLFPQLSAAIDAGHTVEDYADPYKQLAVKTLEIPKESINFMDGQWRSALEKIDPKTGLKTVMTLTEWEQQMKTDPKYGYDKTNQAVDEAATLANMIAKKFGKVA